MSLYNETAFALPNVAYKLSANDERMGYELPYLDFASNKLIGDCYSLLQSGYLMPQSAPFCAYEKSP